MSTGDVLLHHDDLIAVGYRVNSDQAPRFRIRATKTPRDS